MYLIYKIQNKIFDVSNTKISIINIFNLEVFILIVHIFMFHDEIVKHIPTLFDSVSKI